MRVGELVRESEQDAQWQIYPGETGVVLRRADEEMGLPGCGRFWMVRWSDGEFVMLDTELERVSAGR